MTMDLERYNRSYEEIVEILDDEVEQKMLRFRQQCLTEFINRLNQREQEWEATFRILLEKSREDDIKSANEASSLLDLAKNISNSQKQNLFSRPIFETQIDPSKSDNISQTIATKSTSKENGLPIRNITESQKPSTPLSITKSKSQDLTAKKTDDSDPHFNNSNSIKEFIRLQKILEQNRLQFDDINTNPINKTFKNEINLFIRTQINAISNSDTQHLESKIKNLTNLLVGQGVSFQDRFIDSRRHPQGQLFSADLAAQTFVNVGIKLVNSVPAIAKSMGIVINGIVDNNIQIFKDIIIGHLQQQCPYLVPMHIDIEDFANEVNKELKYKIACGYSYDPKSLSLELEEKYLIRMRSMTLIFACFLIQGHLGMAWTWLTSFLSLKPQPVISATILQAFLQEASKKLSTTYGRQYKKLLNFIKIDYVKMIERVTPKGGDKQSLIKLKNLLSDDANLIAGPTLTSIFGAIRY